MMNKTYKRALLRAYIAGVENEATVNIEVSTYDLRDRIALIRNFLAWLKEFEKEELFSDENGSLEVIDEVHHYIQRIGRGQRIAIVGPGTYPCTRKEIDEQLFGLRPSIDFTITAKPIIDHSYDENREFRGKNKSKRKYPRPK